MRVSVADAKAHVQRLDSIVQMATVLEGSTTEVQRSVVRFICAQTKSMRRIFTKKCFLFMVGSVCSVKRFTTGSRNSTQGRSKVSDDETEIRNWLRKL
jgi:hypothetical protein